MDERILTFSPEEKEYLFDQIAERYFNKNFGTTMKSELECLIFSVYIENCLKNGLPYDDYTLSKNLGITENKARSLKERKELRYPYKNYKWKESFVNLIENAKYNETKQLVQLNIEDINLLKDVRHFIRSQGWYDEFQLNPRLFQCRLDYFILLCKKLGNEIEISDNAKKELQKLAKNEQKESAINKIIQGSFEDGMKDLLTGASKEIIIKVLKFLPFGGLAETAIKFLIKALEK